MAMLSCAVAAKMCVSWNTNATESINRATGMSRMSTPPMATEPRSGSRRRASSCPIVLLPPPDGPTSAVIVPSRIVTVTPSSAHRRTGASGA